MTPSLSKSIFVAPRNASFTKRIVVATFAVFVALAARYVIPPTLLTQIPFLLFFTAVVAAGVYGGFWTGVYATFLSAVLSYYFFIPPVYFWLKDDWHQYVKMLLYIVDCLSMAALCGSLHKLMVNLSVAEHASVADRKLFESLFDISPAAMVLFKGPDFVIERANSAYQDIFRGRELIGQSFFDVAPEMKGQIFLEQLEDVLKTGKPLFGRAVLAKILNAEGVLEDRYYDYSYHQVLDEAGEPYGVYDHAVDVTDAILAKREMEVSRSEADAANKAKSQFLANMSHEIRTPLGAIIGFSDLLKTAGLTDESFQKYLSIIDRNSKHLLSVVDDVLDLSKVEAGMVRIETVSFSLIDLLTEVRSSAELKAREKSVAFNLKFKTEVADTIISDPTRLKQILNNVLSNAIKFTFKGAVSLTLEQAGRKLAFTVHDTGIGISAEQAALLFKPFQQADASTTRNFGGTGLGLALTRGLAESMGGSFILVSSKIGFGSEFRVEIEIEVSESARQVSSISNEHHSNSRTQSPAPNEQLGHLKILVIEDSIDNQVLIRLMLARLGASVEIASDGSEGVRAARANRFDLILCDIQMPIMDGYEAVREIRKQDKEIPIIALSAHAMKEEYQRALANGFTDYLTKPIDRAALFQMLRKYETT